MGCWEHVITDSWLDFVRDCLRTFMYCPINWGLPPSIKHKFQWNDFTFVYFEQDNRGWLHDLCNFQDLKIWNQELSFPSQHLICVGSCIAKSMWANGLAKNPVQAEETKESRMWNSSQVPRRLKTPPRRTYKLTSQIKGETNRNTEDIASDYEGRV